MKKILKILVLGLLSAALLCCALPSAFAAEDKDSQVYTIGLDAMGGRSFLEDDHPIAYGECTCTTDCTSGFNL